jgi:aerobic-type carbon monoxide dehydrogenase small subunit (CoxS/CutS family)
MLAVQADGAELMTVEGLAPAGRLHPLQEAFREHHALQCGFCTLGMLLDEIRHGLSAVLCRCTGYQGIIAAVAAAARASLS